MKLLVIFGTRPEAIKVAPVIQALRNHSGIRPVVCVTAQQREMLDQILSMFEITPDYDLNIMQPNQSLFDVVSNEHDVDIVASLSMMSRQSFWLI